MRIYILLVTVIFSFLASVASEMRFRQIGLAEGLTHATVNSIACDADGFLWVATPEGLARFDGYVFRSYSPETDASAPGIRFVTSIGPDLWAAGNRSLLRYDRSTDAFASYPLPSDGTDNNNIRTFAAVDDSVLIVGTSDGMYAFNSTTGNYRPILPALRHTAVNTLIAFDGRLYAGLSKRGVVAIDSAGRLEFLNLPPDTDVNTLFADGKSLVIGTEGRGLFFYNPETRTLTKFEDEGHNPNFASAHIRSLASDAFGRIWAGTFDGLFIIDQTRRKATEIPTGKNGISHSSVRALCPDHQGGIWLGTFYGGLNYYNPLNNQFTKIQKAEGDATSLNDNVISTMAESSDGRIWIGTNNGGVNVYNPDNGQFRYYTAANGLGSNDVKAIYIDEQAGKVYIGTHIGAMTVLDTATGRLTSAGVPSRNVFAIEPTLSGDGLWLNVFDGLMLYDKRTGKTGGIIRLDSPTGRLKRSLGLLRDSDGRLWVYGEDGLGVFDEQAGKLTEADFEIPGASGSPLYVNSVFQSSDGTYWVGHHGGLMSFRRGDKEARTYGTADGLPGNIVYAISEDPSGKIWVSTNEGLAAIRPKTGAVAVYNSNSALQRNQFTPRSSLYTSRGRMMFGGINGISVFNPSVLEENPYAPKPLLTELRLFDAEVTPGDATGLLSSSLATTERLTFRANQTSFTIGFTACNFPAEGNNTFYYKLEGLDKQWIPVADGARSVTYSNLPSGNYTFMVKAANNDGVMSDETASVGIRILPVWYLSWWAIILWCILALGLVYIIIRALWNRRMMAEQMRLQKMDFERQQQIEEMKVRFFVNMSHELRTPLTLMLVPLDELLARSTDPVATDRLTTVRNNTLRILHIVNQLLDYRRAEMGMFKLKVSNTDVNTLARSVFESYKSMAQHKNISYTLQADAEPATAAIDVDYFELILNNLLTNAFKYTPRGQSVSVAVSRRADKLRIAVADTGCGIAPDKLEAIFTRFYQVNDSSGGNGIGLSLVKRLVDLHHGTITVESEPGKGSVFTVELPALESAYSELEKRTADDIATESRKSENQEFIYIPDAPDFTEPDETEESEQSEASGRPTVLVADDNAEILKLISDSLAADYRVLVAANGAKAIELMANDNIDLIITDVMMPDVDGVQLCRAVKRNLRTSHIPVIMLSAKSDLSDQLGGMKVGADDYIPKPFSMELLKSKIRNQFRTRARLIDMYSKTADFKLETAATNPLDEEFLRKAAKVMEEHLDDSEFSTEEFAAQMCMSRSNLHLKMKALTGESSNEFIRRTRMNKAMELLRTGRYTVAEISAMVGYGTASYFATSFKKTFGKSPSEYLKNG